MYNPRKHVWRLVALLAGLGIFVALLINAFQSSPQVAEIGTSASYCTSNIASISFQSECGPNAYKATSFKCTNSTAGMGTVFPVCTSYVDALAQAQKVCGQTCIYPSPSISPTPTPSPTASPTQLSFSCNVNVYKLKATDDPKANPSSYATLDRRIDPAQARIIPGEYYALMVDSMATQNIQVSTVSAVTSNVAGSDEPIRVVATTPYCSSTDSWGKYMSCTHPGVSYTASKPLPLKIGMTIGIQDNVYNLAKTSIRFGLYNILAGGSGYSSECYVTMMAAESSATPTPTPKPTPTPTPVPPTGCTYERSTCLNTIFGGECKLLLVCPTPTPTSKPSPIPSSGQVVVLPPTRPTPTPLPIAPSGCYYQRRYCARTFYGGTCAPALYCPKPPRPPYGVCMKTCRVNSPYARCVRSCLAR